MASRGPQIKRRIGRAWIVRGDAAPGDRRHSHNPGWIKRRGRPEEDYLTADMALANVPAVVAAWQAERAQIEVECVVPVTFDEAAAAWLDHASTVRGIKPSTLADYTAALRQPDYQPKRRGHTPVARIMAAFGGRPIDSITSTDVSQWLTKLDRNPVLSARTVNKHRQILHAIFKHACRADTFALAANPVAATEKRREADLAEIVTYSPAEVFVIARALSNGEHRDPRRPALSDDEIAVRLAEDEQDAALVILAGFAGLRMGELIALRWRHINFQAQRLHIQRSYSAGEESSPKGRKGRTVPLAHQPAHALARLGAAAGVHGTGDLVFCSRIGSHRDGSALRRRYKRARDVVCAHAPTRPTCRRCASTTCVTRSGPSPPVASTSSTFKRCLGTRTHARRRGTCTLGRPRRMRRS